MNDERTKIPSITLSVHDSNTVYLNEILETIINFGFDLSSSMIFYYDPIENYYIYSGNYPLNSMFPITISKSTNDLIIKYKPIVYPKRNYEICSDEKSKKNNKNIYNDSIGFSNSLMDEKYPYPLETNNAPNNAFPYSIQEEKNFGNFEEHVNNMDAFFNASFTDQLNFNLFPDLFAPIDYNQLNSLECDETKEFQLERNNNNNPKKDEELSDPFLTRDIKAPASNIFDYSQNESHLNSQLIAFSPHNQSQSDEGFLSSCDMKKNKQNKYSFKNNEFRLSDHYTKKLPNHSHKQVKHQKIHKAEDKIKLNENSQFPESNNNFNIIGRSANRIKERKIKEVLQKVKLWRQLSKGYKDEAGNFNKLGLEMAAQKIGWKKKSLDDYYFQIKKGKELGFDFLKNLGKGIGTLRQFVKEAKFKLQK